MHFMSHASLAQFDYSLYSTHALHMLASMLAKAKHAREVVHAIGREQHKRERHRQKRDD